MSASLHESPLHAPFCADKAGQFRAAIVENIQLARDTFRVRIDCPNIARSITPGQFVMLRLADANDPLLGRPLALYDTVVSPSGEPQGLDIVYLVAGKFTRRLACCRAGEMLDVWGPLGNGFPPQATEHLIMVAGGIGQTPFLALAAEHLGHKQYGQPARSTPKLNKISFCYGARSAEYLAGVDDFRRLGIDVRISTDDGTAGHHGLVTDVLKNLLAESELKSGVAGVDRREPPPNPRAAGGSVPTGVVPSTPATQNKNRNLEADANPSACQIVCCGPERMMEAVAEIAHHAGVPCQVSLETPMACGIGICFTCVAKVRQSDGSWDYKRTCVEGPIFDAAKIVW